MLLCSKCKKWTHYACTKLPAYQLFLLINTSRKYTCEAFTVAPHEFKEKWQVNTDQPNESTFTDDGKTFDLISRIEKCIVNTITATHNDGKDETIAVLKEELRHQKSIASQALEFKSKLSDSTASTRQEETINKVDKQMRILSQQMEEISTIKLNMMEILMRANKANEAVTMSMENTRDVLGKNAEACQSISNNLTMISKNIQLYNSIKAVNEHAKTS